MGSARASLFWGSLILAGSIDLHGDRGAEITEITASHGDERLRLGVDVGVEVHPWFLSTADSE